MNQMERMRNRLYYKFYATILKERQRKDKLECEHQHEETMYQYKTACGNHIGELVYRTTYIYCPYCGKKIRLVEENNGI